MSKLLFFRSIVVLVFVLSGFSKHAQAQSIADSLRLVVNKKLPASETERIAAKLQLVTYVFFNEEKTEAIELLQQVVKKTAQNSDEIHAAKAHAQLSFLYRIMGKLALAKKNMDTANLYATKSSDRAIKAYIRYAEAWHQSRANEPQKATRNLLEGLRLLEGLDEYKTRKAIYTELVGIYSSWKDLENFEHYVRLELGAAQKVGGADQLTAAWQQMGSFYEEKFRKEQNKVFLDSALVCYKKSFQIGKNNWNRLIFKNQQALTANNIAFVYFKFNRKTRKDSVFKYMNIAIDLGKKTEQHSVVATSYGILSEYAMADGEYDQAITYLNAAFLELANVPLADKFTLSQIAMSLSYCYEKKGNPEKALHYYKQYLDFYKAVFDQQKMKISKSLEEKYQSEKKEKALIKAKYEASQKARQLLMSRFVVEKQKKAIVSANLKTTEKEKALAVSRYQTQAKEKELIKIQYKTEKQQQHLSELQQRIAYEKKLKIIYIVLAIAALLSSLILYYAYKQRSRALRQKEQLHALEVNKITQTHRISLLSAMLDGEEKERTRLARDLHDGLGGLLSGTKIELSEMLALSQSEKPRQLVKQTLTRLDDAVDELRRIAHSMMPELLLKYGLAEATREYCNKLNGANGTKVVCQIINYSNTMNHNRQVVLYRVIQELVNNAIKHANAKMVLVELQQSNNTLCLTVEDDGLGMNDLTLQKFNGAGLANIKSRIDFLEGTIELQTQPDLGTTFTVECKL